MTHENLEMLLEAWIHMEMSIRGNRILSDYSFNEMVICHILIRSADDGRQLTATQLGQEMHLLKSQMNHLLTSMEENGYIRRVRSDTDRRKVYIEIREAGRQRYDAEHQRILQIMGALSDGMGESNFMTLGTLMGTATDIVKGIQEQNCP